MTFDMSNTQSMIAGEALSVLTTRRISLDKLVYRNRLCMVYLNRNEGGEVKWRMKQKLAHPQPVM